MTEVGWHSGAASCGQCLVTFQLHSIDGQSRKQPETGAMNKACGRWFKTCRAGKQICYCYWCDLWQKVSPFISLSYLLVWQTTRLCCVLTVKQSSDKTDSVQWTRELVFSANQSRAIFCWQLTSLKVLSKLIRVVQNIRLKKYGCL